MTPFEDYIRDLGTALGLPLYVDAHGACCLQMNKKIRVQLEPDKSLENLLVVALIGEVNPGRFREEILKEALKANDRLVAMGIGEGILGFSAHHNKLTCHTILPFSNTTSELLLSSLLYLSEFSLLWADALLSDRAPVTRQKATLPAPHGFRP